MGRLWEMINSLAFTGAVGFSVNSIIAGGDGAPWFSAAAALMLWAAIRAPKTNKDKW